MQKKITSPFSDKTIADLKAGDQVLISGVMYVGRDSAHKRLVEAMNKGDKLPFDVKGQVIYYMGPSPTKPGKVIGSAGPTTSGRMDAYTPRMLEAGLKGMVGKGLRTKDVKEAIVKSEIIAYEELGPEALLRIEVKDFPAIVINDMYGGDLYEEGKAKYRQQIA
jgi:fumarate hydratase subunit beta